MYYFGLIIPHCTKVLTLPSINVYDLYMKSFFKSTRELENVKKLKSMMKIHYIMTEGVEIM